MLSINLVHAIQHLFKTVCCVQKVSIAQLAQVTVMKTDVNQGTSALQDLELWLSVHQDNTVPLTQRLVLSLWSHAQKDSIVLWRPHYHVHALQIAFVKKDLQVNLILQRQDTSAFQEHTCTLTNVLNASLVSFAKTSRVKSIQLILK